MSYFGFFSAMVFVALLASPSFGEFRTDDESPIVTDSYTETTVVEDDGSSKFISEEVRTLKQEAERQEFGVKQFSYDPHPGVDKIIEMGASVTNDGVETKVPDSEFEDAPIASDGFGFKSENQVTINYPDVQVGSQTRFYLHEESHPATTGDTFFSGSVNFGGGELFVKSLVTYISNSKLNIWVNDPEGYLKIDERVVPEVKFGNSVLQNKHVLTIELLRPVYKDIKEETNYILNGGIVPWVKVSNKSDWGSAREVFAQKYERIINQPLPPKSLIEFNKIKPSDTDEQKLGAVLAAVQKEAVYFGDWRLIDGGYIPHNLLDIENVGKADCKDMATFSVAMMRRLGFDAHVAFVHRQEPEEPIVISPLPDAVVDDFTNHAIVWVRRGAKVYWLDPTNQQSFLGINTDIMDRPSVVLVTGDKSFMSHTPQPDFAGNLIRTSLSITPAQDNDVHILGKIDLVGKEAVDFTTANMTTVKKDNDLNVLGLFADPATAKNVKIQPYTLPDRIVSDQHFSVAYDLEDYFTPGSDGLTFALNPAPGIYPLSKVSANRVSDIDMRTPHTSIMEITLRNLSLKGQKQFACSLDSQWVAATRLVRETNVGIEVSSTYTFKSDRIAATDFSSPEFHELQKNIKSCFNTYNLTVQPKKARFNFFKMFRRL